MGLSQSISNRRFAEICFSLNEVFASQHFRGLIKSVFNLRTVRQKLYATNPDSALVGALIKELLFRNSKSVVGFAAQSNLFRDPVAPSESSLYAANALIARLSHRPDEFGIVDSIKVGQVNNSTVAFGGPLTNPISRTFLGTGTGSPVFWRYMSSHLKGSLPRLPVSFDLSEAQSLFKLGIRDSAVPDWPMIVEDRRIDEPGEYLILTSLPNFYSTHPEANAITLISGRGAPGTRLIEVVLSDPVLIEQIRRATKGYMAWQILLKFDQPRWLDNRIFANFKEMAVFEIPFDLDPLFKNLSGRPFLSNPVSEQHSNFLGLLADDVAPNVLSGYTNSPSNEYRSQQPAEPIRDPNSLDLETSSGERLMSENVPFDDVDATRNNEIGEAILANLGSEFASMNRGKYVAVNTRTGEVQIASDMPEAYSTAERLFHDDPAYLKRIR